MRWESLKKSESNIKIQYKRNNSQLFESSKLKKKALDDVPDFKPKTNQNLPSYLKKKY